MNLGRLGLGLLLLATFTTFISGCSGNEPKNVEIIYYAEGENWNAQYKTNPYQSAKEKVELNFFYKGSMSELLETNEIVFAYGTRNGNTSLR